jgi:hypothetical protein
MNGARCLQALERAPVVWLAVAYALLLAFLSGLPPRNVLRPRLSAHVTSRLATIDSLVARHTFAVDDSPFVHSVDKVRIGGHFYSHQPPAIAVAGAAFYYPLFKLGYRLPLEYPAGDRPGPAFPLLVFALDGAATVFTLVLFYAMLGWTGLGKPAKVLMTAALGIGTLFFSYSITLNSHSFAGALLFAGFYSAVAAKRRGMPGRMLFLSGLAFSLAGAADHGTAVFYPVFGLYLLFQKPPKRRLLLYLLPLALTVLPTLCYYYWISGSPGPVATRAEFFDYPGSVWNTPGGANLTGTSLNPPAVALRQVFRCLFGSHGFLVYNPLLWIALWSALRRLVRGGEWRDETLAAAIASLVMAGYFFLYCTNHGGACYSVRWFVALVPVGWFLAWDFFRLLSARRLAVFLVVFAVAGFYAFAGALDPWPEPGGGYATPVHIVKTALG